jgi:hypothetical protein
MAKKYFVTKKFKIDFAENSDVSVNEFNIEDFITDIGNKQGIMITNHYTRVITQEFIYLTFEGVERAPKLSS